MSAQAYAHAVHLSVPAGALPSDSYFDLLPGETREVRILSDEPLDETDREPVGGGVAAVDFEL